MEGDWDAIVTGYFGVAGVDPEPAGIAAVDAGSPRRLAERSHAAAMISKGPMNESRVETIFW